MSPHQMSFLSRNVERRETLVLLDARVCPAKANQESHNLEVPVYARQVQSGPALRQAQVHVDWAFRFLRQVELHQ